MPVCDQNRFRLSHLLLALLPLMLIGGCRSTAGLFLPVNNHPEIINEARRAVIQRDIGNLDTTLKDLDKRTPQASRMLLLLESARLKALAGEDQASTELFAEAGLLAEQEDLRAVLTVTESFQRALSMITNDRALPYRAKLFERLFLYYFQSLNYLNSGDPAKARIELNKALRDMRWWKDNLPALRSQTDQMLAQNGISAAELPPGYNRSPAEASGPSSSDNALIYYMSALLHQAAGDADRAEIDYRNALAYSPGAEPVLHALETLENPDPEQARLVIIHESDWVASKVPFSISIFIKRDLYSLSFPVYPDNSARWRVPELPVRMSPRIPEPYPLLNINSIVHRALEEEFPGILLRQALRILAKNQLQDEAREADPWLGLAASIFSALSDYPDLRSWLSLPGSISLTDTTLPPGTYEFSPTGPGMDLREITLTSGQTQLIRLVSAGGNVIKVDSMTIPSYHSIK